MTDRKDYNRHLIEEFRANAGRVTGAWTMPLLLLTTTGAKSGECRTTPLGFFPDGDRLLVIASNLGAPAHPDWYYNLVAHPHVTVEVGAETFDATVDLMEGEERKRLWTRIVVVNECGSHIALTPLYAWAPKGKRAYGSVPRNRGKNLTLMAALSRQGMGASMLLEGAADGAAFELYVEQILLREQRMQGYREEIRRIALYLQAEQVTLTQRHIARYLAQPAILRDPKVRELLREVCHEVASGRIVVSFSGAFHAT